MCEIHCPWTNQRTVLACGIHHNVAWGQRPGIVQPPYRINWRCGSVLSDQAAAISWFRSSLVLVDREGYFIWFLERVSDKLLILDVVKIGVCSLNGCLDALFGMNRAPKRLNCCVEADRWKVQILEAYFTILPAFPQWVKHRDRNDHFRVFVVLFSPPLKFSLIDVLSPSSPKFNCTIRLDAFFQGRVSKVARC